MCVFISLDRMSVWERGLYRMCSGGGCLWNGVCRLVVYGGGMRFWKCESIVGTRWEYLFLLLFPDCSPFSLAFLHLVMCLVVITCGHSVVWKIELLNFNTTVDEDGELLSSESLKLAEFLYWVDRITAPIVALWRWFLVLRTPQVTERHRFWPFYWHGCSFVSLCSDEGYWWWDWRYWWQREASFGAHTDFQ